jgi:hypothetical protein
MTCIIKELISFIELMNMLKFAEIKKRKKSPNLFEIRCWSTNKYYIGGRKEIA